MNEKTRVKSYIRKGKIVRSFDRKGKKRKKLILGSLGALGAIGLAGIGGLALSKGKLGSKIIKSPMVSSVNVLPSKASVISAKTIDVVQPKNLPKLLKRPKTSSKSKKIPILSTNKPTESKVLSNSQNNSTSYQINDDIENRIASRIPDDYEYFPYRNPHNLTKAEMYSLSEYSGYNYNYINRALRDVRTNKGLQQDLQDEVNAIRSGLNKMPSTNSPVVYRGVRSRDEAKLNKIFDSYEIGKEISEPAFLSTSIEDMTTFGNKLRYEIKPKAGSQGKDISDYTQISGEKEILFPPNTPFKIVDKFIKGDTKWIRMEEV